MIELAIGSREHKKKAFRVKQEGEQLITVWLSKKKVSL